MRRSEQSSGKLLDVQNVVAGYRGSSVLDGISINVPPSAVVALLGANGVGKTTLLRAVGGMLPCRRGKITLNGRRIDGMPAHRVSRMGVAHVPEGRGIFPGLTVRENLDLARFATRKAPSEEFGLDLFPALKTRLGQLGGTLSGGEQQMLSIARALATNPEVLLLDEPSLGLAPKIVRSLYESLHEVKGRGVGMLIAEQAAQEALSLADYVYVVGVRGRVHLAGTPSEVMQEADLFSAYMR